MGCPRPGNELAVTVNASPGQAVYEPFSGSGSTIIAAETCDRAMDLDPAHVDVAVLHWQAFTGEVAALDGDGRTFSDQSPPRAYVTAKQ